MFGAEIGSLGVYMGTLEQNGVNNINALRLLTRVPPSGNFIYVLKNFFWDVYFH